MIPVWRSAHPNNFRKGRGGFAPEVIVIHVIADKLDNNIAGTDAWFQNPEAKVSAHYAVRADGLIHHYVEEADTAFHAGVVHQPVIALPHNANPNLWTIGIEHEGNAETVWPDAMYEASAELIAGICRRWNIRADREHIVMHREIRSNKACPGKCDIDRLVGMVQMQLAERPVT